MRASLFASSCLLLSALLASAATAQTVLPNPNLQLKTFGEINAFARQPDGGLVLGGQFTSIDGTPRTNLARLLPDGSLDPDWSPATDGAVHALAVDATGAVFVGGDFLHVDGIARNRLAKLSGYGTGAPDPGWQPSSNGRVNALGVDPTTGALFAGGWFTQVDGYARAQLAKLAIDGAGEVDPDWNPLQNTLIEEMVVVSGAVYAGGNGQYGTAFYPSLGKFHTTGTGARFAGWVAARGGPYSLAVEPATGNLLVGGTNGVITRLSGETGARSGGWDLDYVGRITALAVDGSTVYAGATYRLTRLPQTGGQDVDWTQPLSGAVRALVPGANGSIVAGGTFSEAGGEARLSAATFDGGGDVGAPIDVEKRGYGNLLARQPDGGVIVAGSFHKANGVTRRGLLRLLPDGTLDPSWNPDTRGEPIYGLAVDPNSGDVYVGGDFTRIGEVARYHLAKISGVGAGVVDPLWNPSPSGAVTDIVVDGTGDVYVAGFFFWDGDTGSNIGGQRRDRLAKLSGTGTGAADADWNPAPSGQVNTLALDGTGGLLVGGIFSQIGGQTRAGLARLALSGIGAVDSFWTPSANSYVLGLDLDTAGWVYVRGEFNSLSGLPRAGLGRIALQGGEVDAAWNPQPNGRVNAIAFDEEGSIYAGGAFTAMGSQSKSYLARLSPFGSGAADPRWNPGVGGPGVAAIAVDVSSGTLYAAGTFTEVGSEQRSGLVALAPPLFSDGFESPIP